MGVNTGPPVVIRMPGWIDEPKTWLDAWLEVELAAEGRTRYDRKRLSHWPDLGGFVYRPKPPPGPPPATETVLEH